jgi:hypothetical protein
MTSVADFVEIAVDDLKYLGEQMRYLLALSHEERVLLFHREFQEDDAYKEFVRVHDGDTTTTTATASAQQSPTNAQETGICREMLKALWSVGWPNHGRALVSRMRCCFVRADSNTSAVRIKFDSGDCCAGSTGVH